MIRTFIALAIPESPALRRLHERLSILGGGLRPVAKSGMHVTLKFLGDTHERQVPEIMVTMQRVAARQRAHEIRLAGLGPFRMRRGLRSSGSG